MEFHSSPEELVAAADPRPSDSYRLSPDAPRSLARCAAMAIQAVPGKLVVFYLRSRRCSHRRRLQCFMSESTSQASFWMTGFQATLIGCFWVTPEAPTLSCQ